MTLVSSISSRPVEEISAGSRLSDLGFDSLMFVELATSIENAGGSISAPERFNEIQDVRELIGVVNRRGSSSAKQEVRPEERGKDEEIYIPSVVRSAGEPAIEA